MSSHSWSGKIKPLLWEKIAYMPKKSEYLTKSYRQEPRGIHIWEDRAELDQSVKQNIRSDKEGSILSPLTHKLIVSDNIWGKSYLLLWLLEAVYNADLPETSRDARFSQYRCEKGVSRQMWQWKPKIWCKPGGDNLSDLIFTHLRKRHNNTLD